MENYTLLPAIDQLTAVGYPGGRTTIYTYDPAGNRATTTCAYDGDAVRVSEDTWNGPKSLLHDRVTTDGQPDLIKDEDEDCLHLMDGVVEADGSTVNYPLADGLGSVRTVIGADGAVSGSTS